MSRTSHRSPRYTVLHSRPRERSGRNLFAKRPQSDNVPPPPPPSLRAIPFRKRHTQEDSNDFRNCLILTISSSRKLTLSPQHTQGDEGGSVEALIFKFIHAQSWLRINSYRRHHSYMLSKYFKRLTGMFFTFYNVL